MNNEKNKENATPKPVSQPSEGSAAEYNHIKYVLAVMSGKGGVGKSFVTSLLATALARKGFEVGILDADITGPSIPTLFGLHGPVESEETGIHPLKSLSGIKIISMNLLLAKEDLPIIWRGPLISKAIRQLWGDVMWGDLDYLLIDLPPGTADVALTIMQSVPVNGIVMVTLPQGLSSLIVRKAVHMAQHIGVPIIGIIENMSYFLCPDTQKRYDLFGQSHAEEVAKAAGAPLLAVLPIDPNAATLCDQGKVEDIKLAEIETAINSFILINKLPRSKNDIKSKKS